MTSVISGFHIYENIFFSSVNGIRVLNLFVRLLSFDLLYSCYVYVFISFPCSCTQPTLRILYDFQLSFRFEKPYPMHVYSSFLV